MKLPLEGVKVLELGTHLVVPNASRIMADWGAEVIKIEGFTGDLWRITGLQYSTPVTDNENPLFAEENANKKFISINLKTDEGLEIIKKLATDTDVFMSNVRMKSLSKLGLDYDSLKRLNEKLIYAHFSGYGNEGPDAPRPGFDLAAYWARSGTMCDWISPGDFPFRPPGGYGDAVCGTTLATGILAALYGREKSGIGTSITCSLYGAGLWYNQVGVISAQPHYGNTYPKSKMKPVNPFSHIYKCKDNEWIIITVSQYDTTNYVKCCTILGMEEYIEDERYNNLINVQNNIEEFITIINEKFMQKNRSEWKQIFTEADIVNENLVHVKDVIQDTQAWVNGYLKNITYPESGNTTAFPTFPVQFKDYDVEKFELPGAIGRDTKEILQKYGYTEKDYDELVAKKAVK